jgi:hypothetical protein
MPIETWRARAIRDNIERDNAIRDNTIRDNTRKDDARDVSQANIEIL